MQNQEQNRVPPGNHSSSEVRPSEAQLASTPERDKFQKLRRSIVGCLIGTAVGDSLGLPFEGLSPQRRALLFYEPCRHAFIGKSGMVSDDTEQSAMLAQALIESGFDRDKFQKQFARRLRVWAALVPAGIGLATLRASGKLWLGFSPERSGVNSAGNGAAMRSAILGVVFGDDYGKMAEFVEVSSRVTHTDRRAIDGALVVAVAAGYSAHGAQITGVSFLELLKSTPNLKLSAELLSALEEVVQSVEKHELTTSFAARKGLGEGVSGFVMHTVPVVVHAWLSAPEDFSAAVEQVLFCGGDTDTTGAIVGAIVGARIGEERIVPEWIEGIRDFGFGTRFLRSVGEALAERCVTWDVGIAPKLFLGRRVLRNAYFAAHVLRHGFRRLFPPY